MYVKQYRQKIFSFGLFVLLLVSIGLFILFYYDMHSEESYSYVLLGGIQFFLVVFTLFQKRDIFIDGDVLIIRRSLNRILPVFKQEQISAKEILSYGFKDGLGITRGKSAEYLLIFRLVKNLEVRSIQFYAPKDDMTSFWHDIKLCLGGEKLLKHLAK